MFKYWCALGLAVVANVAANAALKQAARQSGDWTPDRLLTMLKLPTLWIGVLCAGALFGAYVYAIREVPLSVAYPIVTGMAMAGVAILGHFAFGEVLTAAKALGLSFMIGGAVILTISSQP